VVTSNDFGDALRHTLRAFFGVACAQQHREPVASQARHHVTGAQILKLSGFRATATGSGKLVASKGISQQCR
jgi:hypothetical protein